MEETANPSTRQRLKRKRASTSNGGPKFQPLFKLSLVAGILLMLPMSFRLLSSSHQWIADYSVSGEAYSAFFQPSVMMSSNQSWAETFASSATSMLDSMSKITTETNVAVIEEPSTVGIPRLSVIEKPNPFPPMTEVQNWIKNETNRTAAQFVLDFCIIGFAKCGTSTMMHWLGLHPEIQIPPDEILDLQRKEPWNLVETMYKLKSLDSSLLRGYKSPNDIGDVRPIRLLREFFPKSKLLIGIRHPVLMMESFYNFRIQNGFDIVPFGNIGYGNGGRHFGVNLARTEYNAMLALLGKTNFTDDEMDLFSKQRSKAFRNGGFPVKSPHKVLLYETLQLKDEELQPQLLRDIENYLGLTQELPPPLHFKPGRKTTSKIQRERDAKKINICDAEHDEQRLKIMRFSRRTATWILDYFIKSPDVLISNPDHFRQLVEGYHVDPCIERNRTIHSVRNSTKLDVS